MNTESVSQRQEFLQLRAPFVALKSVRADAHLSRERGEAMENFSARHNRVTRDGGARPSRDGGGV